jgi:hypothetical protein
VIALGTGMAVGHVKPGVEHFAALADDEDQAKDDYAWYEAERMEQETIARYTRHS